MRCDDCDTNVLPKGSEHQYAVSFMGGAVCVKGEIHKISKIKYVCKECKKRGGYRKTTVSKEWFSDTQRLREYLETQ